MKYLHGKFVLVWAGLVLFVVLVFVFLPSIKRVAVEIIVDVQTTVLIEDDSGKTVYEKETSTPIKTSLPENRLYLVRASGDSSEKLAVLNTNTNSNQLSADLSSNTSKYSSPIKMSSIDAWAFSSNKSRLIYEDFHSDRIFVDNYKSGLRWYDIEKDNDKRISIGPNGKGVLFTKTYLKKTKNSTASSYKTNVVLLSDSGKQSVLCGASTVSGFGVINNRTVIVTDKSLLRCGDSKPLFTNGVFIGNSFAIGSNGILSYTSTTSYDEAEGVVSPINGVLLDTSGKQLTSFVPVIASAAWSSDGTRLAIVNETYFSQVTDSAGITKFYLPKLTGTALSWMNTNRVLIEFGGSLWVYDFKRNSAERVLTSKEGESFRAFHYDSTTSYLYYSVPNQGTYVVSSAGNPLSYLSNKQKNNLSKFPFVGRDYLIDSSLSSKKPVFVIRPLGIFNYAWQLNQYREQLANNADRAKKYLSRLGFNSTNSRIIVEFPN